MYSWEREAQNLDTTEGQVVITRHYENYGPFTFLELKEWIKDEYWHNEVLLYRVERADTFLAIKKAAEDCDNCYFLTRAFCDWLEHKCQLKQDAIDNGYEYTGGC